MNRDFLALAAGSSIGLGVFVVVAAWRGRLSLRQPGGRAPFAAARHALLGVAVAAATWSTTGWVLVSLTTGVVAGLAASTIRQHGRRRDDRGLVDAVAVWTEQLRDMLAGSNGLEQAIAATAPHAPTILRQHVERLCASISYSPLDQALTRFARDVDHPTADFVVAALSTAATRQVRELGPLLGHLAECAHAESRMHTRIWVGRSRTRSAVKIIGSVVALFVVGLAVLNPDYLAPYRTAEGQVVLSSIVLVFFSALTLMQRFSRVVAPERFVGRRAVRSS